MNELILLAALLRGPAYGYALKNTAGLIVGNKTMHPNVVYPLLKKFVQKGWVEAGSAPGARGQTRKQYRITPQGRNHLVEQLGTFGAREASDDDAFLFRVALFGVLSKSTQEHILAVRGAFLLARSDQLSRLRDITKPKSFSAMALDRVRRLVDDERHWVRTLQARVKRSKEA
jgi:DNA-binding PadR family transcriptional regulator